MQSFSARFEELRQSYVVQLVEKAAQMADDWKKVEAGAASPAILEDIQRVAHNLAGTGSTFGFPQVTSTAHAIEAALRQMVAGNVGGALIAEVHDLMLGLQQIAVGSPEPQAAVDSALPPVIAAVTHVFFLCTDADEGESMAAQVANFGYETRACTHIDELQALVQASSPDALVLDMAFLEHAEDRIAIDQLRHLRATAVPLIVIAAHGGFEERLHAVRCGGSAYLVRPLDVGALIDQLDQFTERQRSEPYRVLIVDDSKLLADTYATFLIASGIEVTVITDPTVVSGKLHDLQPDLILMDMYMPGCGGRELAAVLRQQPELHSIPIVYLSAEMDRGTQLAAMYEGDDFLTKPIDPDHLVAAVTSRIRRARVMRTQMLRDSLTGLFNHSVTEDLLAHEVSRARRNKRPLSMALLDLDHFKQVNDRYGHAVGDRVLKSLARLLQQRLRISDLVGRYGGEEFVVLMPETDGQDAFAVLDSIRARFAQVRHHAGDDEFGVTLSGGVVSLQSSDTVAAMSESADIALYQAKHHGRDQIVLATRNLLRDDLSLVDTPSHVIDSTMILGVQARVLVVDDDPYVRDMLKHWLGSANYEVQFAELGREALIMVPQMNPDLVLLDVLMPDVDGLEVLDLLRSSGCDAAVVLTTAYGSERIAVNAMRRGADDYLRKPIQVEELQTVLNRNLERLRLRRQNSALQRQLEEQRQKLDLELARAAKVQSDLLPRQMPRLPGFTLAARCIPSSLVGGDFYDWHSPGPGLLNLTFGDVMGKGMPAALLMTTVRAVMRSVGRQTPPLVNLRYALTALDQDLNNARAFVTMFHAQLDLVSRRLSFIDAGHGLVFVRRAGGAVETLGPRGVPLGVPSREPYAQGEVQLNPGDALILFSDGLLDTWPALADNHLILAELLSDDVQAPAMVERILALPALVGSVIDDLTVVALSCTAE